MAAAYLDYLAGAALFDLAHRLVYVTVLFAAVFAACRLLGSRLPYLQMMLWSLVLLRAVLPAEFSLPFSAREALSLLVPDLFGFVELRLRFTSLGYAGASPPVFASLPQVTWTILLVGLWALTSGLLLARLMLSRRYFAGLVARGEPADAGTAAMAARWRQCFGIRRQVRVVSGDARVSPFTIGLWRPAVYLPRGLLTSASAAEVDAVLGHELAHVARFDDAWVRLQGVLVAAFCFFPPVHYAARQLARQREIVCDQLAIVRGGLSPRVYGEGLLRVMTGYPRPRGGLPALVGDAQFCSVRIAAIAEAARTGIRAVGTSILLALAVLVFLVPMGPHGPISVAQANLMQERSSRQVLGDPSPGFVLPIAGAELGRGFGAIPRRQQVSYRYHTGLDLHAPVGTEVAAVAPGVVVRVQATPRDSLSARTGGYMIVRHGAYLVYYTYLRDMRVAPGDVVEAGQTLATLGAAPYSLTGSSTYLHLEVTRDGVSVDPLLLLPDTAAL
jgi:beta-lactamase regulating signal transducer with metallopeptidase domain